MAPLEPHLSLLHVGLQAAEKLQRRRGREAGEERRGGGIAGGGGGSGDVVYILTEGPRRLQAKGSLDKRTLSSLFLENPSF